MFETLFTRALSKFNAIVVVISGRFQVLNLEF